MAFGFSNSESVIFRSPAILDTYGELVPTSVTDTTVEGCLYAPGSTSENIDRAQQVDAEGVLYAPDDAPTIDATWRIVIRGDVFQVVGKPKLWAGEGYEIPVKNVTG